MINASIVLYKHSPEEIAPLVEILLRSDRVATVFLIDNSPVKTVEFETLGAHYIFIGKNLGYGAAHNIALRETIDSGVEYHLVLNPDIVLQSDVLGKIEHFMNANKNVGLLMPKVLSPDDEIQYLCKLLPAPSDLFFRRFLPQKWTRKSRERFELRKSGYNKVMDVPYLSGCFMFLRTETLKRAGLFDERFFLYPEDIDLSRRIHKCSRTVFYPEVSVVHRHGQASYKNVKMLFIHIVNMAKYFCKWGWIFDRERKEINKQIVKQFIVYSL
ncbi:MAG: glycosyltransferase family 2 protein [Prevotellaceae bacterium]|jgi:GT2 family glycosyltransferase|nr:glycosyltransferase family 2 protein [Prevotellaceae bacterium]